MAKLTHIDETGAARMVNVGAKPRTNRRAVAKGEIRLSDEAFALMLAGAAQKGDVLGVARVAGIMAAKRTSELIPLCHNVPLASIVVDLEPEPDTNRVLISAEVENIDRTGVEMEALTAVSVAALTIYDMLKAVDRHMTIGAIRLVEKSGGAHVIAEAPVAAAAAPMPLLGGNPTPAPSIAVVPKGATMPGLFPPPELLRHDVPAAPPETAAVSAPAPPAARAESRPPDAESPPVPALRAPPEVWKPRPVQSSTAASDAARVREYPRAEIERLHGFLAADRFSNAYLLGDLDTPFEDQCKWFGLPTAAGDDLEGLVLLYNGLSMPAVLTAGPPAAVEALVLGARSHLPRRFYANIRQEHREAVETQYAPRAWTEMVRMGLHRADWRPETQEGQVEALTHRDTAAIMHLYRHYPDNFFDPAQLGTGLYYGVREDGELISVAGVHVVSQTYDVAVIGNIVTHTEHRGRGLASRCVAQVLESLFAQVTHVALNVQASNVPALACYRRFGFTEQCKCLEGWVQAR
jgi:cyclic pyranopterin phosphate synthase